MGSPMGERDWPATRTSTAIADPHELASWVNEIPGYRTSQSSERVASIWFTHDKLVGVLK